MTDKERLEYDSESEGKYQKYARDYFDLVDLTTSPTYAIILTFLCLFLVWLVKKGLEMTESLVSHRNRASCRD